MDVDATRSALDQLAAGAAQGDEAVFRERLQASAAALHDYLTSFVLEGTSTEFTASYVGDALQRFIHTLEFVPLPPGQRILELGANPYFFHLLLRRLFPQARIEGANFFDHNIFSDRLGSATHRTGSRRFGEEWVFSYPVFNLETVPRYPYPEASFDLVFFCETLEHLVVNPLPVFRKIRRLLRPGGHLIVTLPNAARLTNLALLLDGHNPFDLYHPETGVHGRHNREFTLTEMKSLLAQNGFEVQRGETRDRFDYDKVPIVAVDYSGSRVVLARRPPELYRVLEDSGGQLADRGDNLYLLARRPEPAARGAGAAPEHGLIVRSRPPAESPRVQAYVDAMADEAGRLTVIGWAFLSDEQGDAGEWIELVLSSEEGTYGVTCSRSVRQDVADRHGLDRTDPGFQVTVDKTALPAGRYRLGVLLGGPGLEEGFRDLRIEIGVG